MSDRLTQRVATSLGMAGLLPFALMALALAAGGFAATAFWQYALMSYGAIILSFVGALHWGVAMIAPDIPEPQRRLRLIWSVMPALAGWAALLLYPEQPRVAALLLFAGFWAHYFQDRLLVRQATLPAWFMPLRLSLTTAVSFCLMVAMLVAGAPPGWI